jgi:uncharacterized protein (DUF924 family)
MLSNSVELRTPETSTIDNAERHGALPDIFMFGRFPHRNKRPGRETTGKEEAYLAMKGTQGFVDGLTW